MVVGFPPPSMPVSACLLISVLVQEIERLYSELYALIIPCSDLQVH
jgi:hypothetical protein